MERELWYVDLRTAISPLCEIVIWLLNLVNSSYSMVGVCILMYNDIISEILC